MRQSLASQSFINNERLFKERQESYSKKNQNVVFFFFLSFFIIIIFEVFRRSNSIFQSQYVCSHTIWAVRLNIWQLPFSIREENVHNQFQQTICDRAGVEPATSGSAVRLAVDARDSAARYTWAAAWQSQQNGHCAQRRHRSACASAKSDQSLRCPYEQTLGLQLPIERTTKTLIWSESSLGTKAILIVLSWGGSHSESASLTSLVASEINHIFEGRAL